MTRPSLLEVQSELRIVKRVSWIIALSLTLFLIFLWPIIMTVFGDYSLPVFKFWIIIGHIFVYFSFIYCLIGPLVEIYYLTVWNWIKARRNQIQEVGSSLNLKTLTANLSKSKTILRDD